MKKSENKYTFLVLFYGCQIFVAYSTPEYLMRTPGGYLKFFVKFRERFELIEDVDFKSLDLTGSGGFFELDEENDSGIKHILFDVPTIKKGKKIVLKLLKHYKKDV